MVIWVGQNIRTSNVTVNWGDGSWRRFKDGGNLISAKTFNQLTFDRMTSHQCQRQRKKGFYNIVISPASTSAVHVESRDRGTTNNQTFYSSFPLLWSKLEHSSLEAFFQLSIGYSLNKVACLTCKYWTSLNKEVGHFVSLLKIIFFKQFSP